MKLEKYNLSGKKVGDLTCEESLFRSGANAKLIKDYIVAIRRNLRQWSASTRGRSEVNHSTQKPHKQKGTGKARQGRLSSPQYKGGGVVFGPKPKFNQHVRINQKERASAVRYLLGQFATEGRLFVVEDPVMEAPKTKTVASFVEAMGKGAKIKVLFVLENFKKEIEVGGERVLHSLSSLKYEAFKRSGANVSFVGACHLDDLNAFQLLKNTTVVMSESAFQEYVERAASLNEESQVSEVAHV